MENPPFSLKLLKLSLPKIIADLSIQVSDIQASAGPIKTIKGLIGVRRAIEHLKSIGLLNDLTNPVYSSTIFNTGSDELNLQQAEANRLINNVRQIQTLLSSLANLLTSTVPAEDPGSINIKLPPVNDFDELSRASREIHLALTQIVYNKDVGGQTKIISVENGSIWINVFIGLTAVPVIAGVVWASAVIYKKIQEGRLMEEQIRSLKVKNDSLQDILKAQKAQTDLMIQAEAEHLQSEHFKNQAPENIERIKNSISIFADLIEKGAEVHPALVAQENVSNLFPDTSKLIGLESKIRKLGEGS